MSQSKAEELLMQNGPNRLTPGKQTSTFMLFVRQLKNPFYLLLFTAGFLSFVTYFVDTSNMINLYLSVAIILAALFYCVMSFWQEKRALKVVSGFANLLPEKCLVRRQNSDHEIFAEELVVGDLVWVRNGEKVNFFFKLISYYL